MVHDKVTEIFCTHAAHSWWILSKYALLKKLTCKVTFESYESLDEKVIIFAKAIIHNYYYSTTQPRIRVFDFIR